MLCGPITPLQSRGMRYRRWFWRLPCAAQTEGLLPCFDADIKHPLLKKEALSFSAVTLSLSGNVQKRFAAGMSRPLLDGKGAEGREPSERKNGQPACLY